MKNKLILLFPLLLLLTFAFIILQWWEWVYLDNRWFLFYQYFNNNILNEIFYWFNSWTFYWYDKTTVISARALNTLMTVFLWQNLIFLLYFILNFVFSYLVLKKIFNSAWSAILWWLFFTFNPISIHILNYSSFLLAYSSFPIILYWLINYFKNKKNHNLFIIGIGFLFLISYIRITWLYITLFLFIWWLYYNQIISFIKENKIATIKCISIALLLSSCFIFSLIHPKINWDSENFRWIWNYTNRSIQLADKLYQKEEKTNFYDGFVFEDIIKNFGSEFQDNDIYKIYSFLMLFSIIVIAWLSNNKWYNHITKHCLFWLLFLIMIRNLWLFWNEEIFTLIVFKAYPFIAWELRWIYIIMIPLMSYLVANNYYYIKNKHPKIKYTYILGIFLFCFISIYPLLSFKNNISAKTIKKEAIPIEYIETFTNDKTIREWTLFFPDGYYYNDWNLNFAWSHNPIIMGYNENYKGLLSNNYRLVKAKQSSLWNNINKINDFTYLKNIQLMWLSNIFVFKDVINSPNTNFNWFYNNYDYELWSKEYRNKIDWIEGINLKKQNNKFSQYNLRFWKDFFLYLPNKIINLEISELLKTNIDIFNKPLIIDNNAINRDFINYNINENRSLIEYKKSSENPTIIPLKITPIWENKEILLHLNQTFWNAWKIKTITKKEYESFECIKWTEYIGKVTNSNSCIYNNEIFSFKNLKILFNTDIEIINHFEWNYIWNSWQFWKDQLTTDNDWSYYLAITYEKQRYYFILLCLSFIVIIWLWINYILYIIKLIIKWRK